MIEGPVQCPGQETRETKALLSSLNEFISRAGHDLVGPLNQSGSLLTLFVKRYQNQIDSEADQLLEFLQSSAAKMESVLAGISEYMAIASAPLEFEAMDLNAALAVARASLERQISRTGAVIEADSLSSVTADAAQTAALFRILIGNSIRFRRPDTAPGIRVSCERGGDVHTIAVADNGIGIDPEFRDVVFQPFRRLHGKEYPGVGLGLAAAKLIVERHGGTIGITGSDDSGGACVRFTLPSGR